MESHGHHRHLFIVSAIVLFYLLPDGTIAKRNAVDMIVSPVMAPGMSGPTSSPGPTSEHTQDFPLSYASFLPSKFEDQKTSEDPPMFDDTSMHEDRPTSDDTLMSEDPPTSDDTSTSEDPPNSDDTLTSDDTSTSGDTSASDDQPTSDKSSKTILPSELEPSTNAVDADPSGFSINSVPENVNPKVEKICDLTDHPSLCLGTVAPLLDDKIDSYSVLEASVKATSDLTKLAFSMAKKFLTMPGVPPKVASILRDCADSYDAAMSNFEKATSALPDRDIGTVNAMLSAVITDIGDCEDELSSTGLTVPISNYAEKLTNMTSNCLAIASLLQE